MDPEWVAKCTEVFEALADEKRLDAFFAIARRAVDEGPLSYTEAMDAAGFEDSGHFNYHLSKLTENLLYEVNECYHPTVAGRALLGLLQKGQIHDNDVGLRSETLGASCLQCGTGLVARYNYEFVVGCPNCQIRILPHQLSPEVGADADVRTLAYELDRASREQNSHLLHHRCPDCGGEPAVEFVTRPLFWDPQTDVDVLLRLTCPTCWRNYEVQTVGQVLLGHPTVRAYCADHDVDLFERPQWEYGWARTDRTTTVRSRDPWTIEKVMDVDGCRIVALLEDDGSVSHVDHVPVDPARTERRAGD